jgi:hypothetical protein
LFEEFVAEWTSGKPVDLEVLFERAGPQAHALGRLVDIFLERAPRRQPSAESKRAVADLAARLERREPPLLAARVVARRRVREIAAAIVSACGLPDEAEKLVRSYYQRLELGLLDPAGVSNRVWAVLEQAVAPAAKALAVQGYPYSPSLHPDASFQRLAAGSAAFPAAAPAQGSVPSELERDVAALFIGSKLD